MPGDLPRPAGRSVSLIRGCRRCGLGYPVITQVPTPAGVVEVRLCQPCRDQAGLENAAALTRSTGSDATS